VENNMDLPSLKITTLIPGVYLIKDVKEILIIILNVNQN
jgi:hypothetical protein